MKYEHLIGKSVKGFKFTVEQGGIGYNPHMDKYVGKSATIVAHVNPLSTIRSAAFRFMFEDEETFIYPEQMVLDQLEANRDLSDDEINKLFNKIKQL